MGDELFQPLHLRGVVLGQQPQHRVEHGDGARHNRFVYCRDGLHLEAGERVESGILVRESFLLAAKDADLAHLQANLDKSVTTADAVAVVRELGPIIGGVGGGRPTLAEAGGKNPENVREALTAGRDKLVALLET